MTNFLLMVFLVMRRIVPHLSLLYVFFPFTLPVYSYTYTHKCYQYIGLHFVCCHKWTWHNQPFFWVYVSSSLIMLKDIAINEFHFFLMLHVVKFYLINLLLSRRIEHMFHVIWHISWPSVLADWNWAWICTFLWLSGGGNGEACAE